MCVAELMREFRGAGDGRKVEIVCLMEDLTGGEGVIGFLVSVVEKGEEFDLARVEALKIFELFTPGDVEQYRRIANAICGVLRGSDDVLVKQYAGMAAAGYVDDDELVAEMRRVVFDVCEDVDLRWNVFASIRRNLSRGWAREVMRELMGVEEFRHAAEEALEG